MRVQRSAKAMLGWLLTGCAAATVLAGSGDWPGYLGPTRDGRSPDTGLLKQWPEGGPRLLWEVKSLGPGWSSVAVVSNLIYVTGNEDDKQMLYCFDRDGKEKWKVDQGPKCRHGKYPGARSTPTVCDGKIYVTGGNGLVTCHNASGGEILWKRDMSAELGGKVGGWQYAESVLILDNLAIITPGGDHSVVALDKNTGKDVWQSDLSATAGYSSCIAIRGQRSTIIVNGSQDGLLVVDAKTGKKIWTNNFAANNTANCPTPVYADGYLFWSVGYGKGGLCIKVDETLESWSFKEAWRTEDVSVKVANYVIDQGRIYAGGLACIDLKTGQTKFADKSVEGGTICLADGLLHVFSATGGKVWLVAPADNGFTVKGSFRVAGNGSSWAYPTVIGGRLYLRYDTNLYCYDVVK